MNEKQSNPEEENAKDSETSVNNDLKKKGADLESGENREVIENNHDKIDETETSEEELREFTRNLIEGALYASDKALTIERLSLELDLPKTEIEESMNQLLELYENRSTALEIVKIGEKYQMQIKPVYSEEIRKFAQGGAIAEKYLRTLTIIALKQPILKSKLVKLRGSGAYEHVKYLEDNALIESVKKGRTSELTTTDTYAEMFGLPKNKDEMKKVMIQQLGLESEED
ncbi:MAG: SMC-Scp complex subunit ScpB [Promethearchaeota archaeon]|nr:MAG: SMC-Scp complex subunit ScpB [Candidatus Lokiarchaeota archaeon]